MSVRITTFDLKIEYGLNQLDELDQSQFLPWKIDPTSSC